MKINPKERLFTQNGGVRLKCIVAEQNIVLSEEGLQNNAASEVTVLERLPHFSRPHGMTSESLVRHVVEMFPFKDATNHMRGEYDAL